MLPGERGRVRWPGLLRGVALLGVGVAACVGIAAHFARRVLTPDRFAEHPVTVLAVERDTDTGEPARVWLQGEDTDLPGKYSLIFDARLRREEVTAGHARIGSILEVQGAGKTKRVLRSVQGVDRGTLRPGATGRITGWWYVSPAELGGETQRVALPLPHGVGWGWVIRPETVESGRWALHVHGRGSVPEETLRGVAPCLQAGISSLVMAYRNDLGSPSGLAGRYGLGLAERDDIEAAIGWLRAQGATRVTIFGWSMGGTAAVLAAAGRHADVIDGVVCDSPALDWPDIIRAHARMSFLPRCVAELAMWFMSIGLVRGAVPGARGTDIRRLQPKYLALLLRVPMLIHASPDDSYVPWHGSLRLALLRASRVRLRPASGEHVKLWNVNPEAWEEETLQFLQELRDPSQR